MEVVEEDDYYTEQEDETITVEAIADYIKLKSMRGRKIMYKLTPIQIFEGKLEDKVDFKRVKTVERNLTEEFRQPLTARVKAKA